MAYRGELASWPWFPFLTGRHSAVHAGKREASASNQEDNTYFKTPSHSLAYKYLPSAERYHSRADIFNSVQFIFKHINIGTFLITYMAWRKSVWRLKSRLCSIIVFWSSLMSQISRPHTSHHRVPIPSPPPLVGTPRRRAAHATSRRHSIAST